MAPKIETLFKTPGPQPNGMQATAEGIWILDQVTNQVSLVSYSGAVLKTFDTESDKGSGITDTGSELWLASTYNCQIIKVDRETGATLASFDSPDAKKTGAHGLELKDGKLWIANPPSATIYEVDVAGGNFNVIHTIPAPGDRPHGLAWQNGDLWCVETNHRAFYRLNPKTGETIDKVDIPEPFPEPHGMTLWDGYFWYCDAHTTDVCRLPLP